MTLRFILFHPDDPNPFKTEHDKSFKFFETLIHHIGAGSGGAKCIQLLWDQLASIIKRCIIPQSSKLMIEYIAFATLGKP